MSTENFDTENLGSVKPASGDMLKRGGVFMTDLTKYGHYFYRLLLKLKKAVQNVDHQFR